MAESIAHIESVRIGIDYIKKLIPLDLHCLIQSDLPENKFKPERTIDNFVPDIRFDASAIKIIGEAKTYEDCMRKHSLDQYDSYLNECHLFSGTSHLVVVISMFAFPGVVNYFKRKKKELGSSTNIHIIDSTFPGHMRIL